ncbi:Nucleoside triphosphatase nudI [Raoultella planticola]|uniref:Nucleoside triphosphatase nudI n=1 Tax=Raoultella planticola TaxID=575 RepID=A0A485C8E3_RAOPL|nr:Nucleoside triphosphatase nudI [Raoultella planticola]
MRQRTIVCPLIQNEGHYLLCKMADDRGVFPGQWALSGGGVERANVLKRRYVGKLVRSLARRWQLTQITPWTFSDDIRVKPMPTAVRKRYI